MRLSRMSILLAAETKPFEDGLSQAERTAKSFADSSARQFNRIEKDLDQLAAALGKDTKEFEKLKATLRGEAALNNAARAIGRIGAAAGLSAGEIQSLAQKFGIAGRNQSLSNRFRQDTQSANALEGAFQRLKLLIAGYVGFDALRNVARTSVDLASMQKTFYALTGSMEGRGQKSPGCVKSRSASAWTSLP